MGPSFVLTSMKNVQNRVTREISTILWPWDSPEVLLGVQGQILGQLFDPDALYGTSRTLRQKGFSKISTGGVHVLHMTVYD